MKKQIRKRQILATHPAFLRGTVNNSAPPFPSKNICNRKENRGFKRDKKEEEEIYSLLSFLEDNGDLPVDVNMKGKEKEKR